MKNIGIVCGMCLMAAGTLFAGLRISEICPDPAAADPNGKESGWIELENTGGETADLKDYKILCVKRGKELKWKKAVSLLSREVAPGGRTLVYIGEAYDNSEDFGGDGKTKIYANDVMAVPVKAKPKNFPCVILADAANAEIDRFIIPVDLPENAGFAPGEPGAIVEIPLIDGTTPYRYRETGTNGAAGEWREDGKGRIAAARPELPRGVEGWLDLEPICDIAGAAPGTSIDAGGLARNDAYELPAGRADAEHTGLRLPDGAAAFQTNSSYTVAFWFKCGRENTEHGRPLFDSRPSGTETGMDKSGMILFLKPSGALALQPRDSAGGTQELATEEGTAYDDGRWHHAAIVSGQRAGEAAALWVDGVKRIDGRLEKDAPLQASVPLCFGRAYNSGYWQPFSGAIADVRAAPRALSGGEAARAARERPERRETALPTTLEGNVEQETDGVYFFPGAADATGAYLLKPDVTNETACGETVDFWVKPADLTTKKASQAGDDDVILVDARKDPDRTKGYLILARADGTIWLQRNTGGPSGNDEVFFDEGAKLATNRWSHLTVTFEKGAPDAVLFVNGRLVSRKRFSGPYAAPECDRRFGGSRDPYWTRFKGRMASPRIFSGTVGALEVAKLHNAHPLAGEAGGPVACVYSLPEGAETAVEAGEGFCGLEMEARVDIAGRGTNDLFRVDVQSAGPVQAWFDGAAVTSGVPFRPAFPMNGPHTVSWRAGAPDGACDASLRLARLHPAAGATRAILPHPTPGAANDYAGAIPYGPNAGPLYGVKHKLSDLAARPPAAPGRPYNITMPINPLSGDADNRIAAVTLLYRAQFGETRELAMAPAGTDKNEGALWSADVPAGHLPAPGRLLQWAFRIEDAAGRKWRSPSFQNPDAAYAWYGTIAAPGPGQENGALQNFHLFAEDAMLPLIDRQHEDVEREGHAYGARCAVYDAQTGTYYDNVRIDLRGNSSAGFHKKSHGLRFNKCQPLKCQNPFTGEKLETRKTSFIAEYCDPTTIRQALSFGIWRRCGNLVPFDYPVRLQMNGAFYQIAYHSNRFTDELIEDYYHFEEEDGSVGFSYKNVGRLDPGLGTTAGGIEKKTPDTSPESDLSELGSFAQTLSPGNAGSEQENPELTKTVVRTFNLPAWLNYLAAARITQECDDVWANMCIYCDSVHTGTWMPLAYDQNLSFGQYFREGNVTGKAGLIADRDDHKSHPFYGGWRIPVIDRGNYGIEAVLQSPKFRRLFLRRLRSLMDRILKAPGTPREETPFWQELVIPMTNAVAPDIAADRAKWDYAGRAVNTAIYVWDHAVGFEEGLDDLWNNYIEPRRRHLYVTHSATNTAWQIGYGRNLNAGIPEAQTPVAALAPKIAFAGIRDAAGGTLADIAALDAIVITNGNEEAVDMSGWALSGAVAWTLPPGTVVDGRDVLHLAFDRTNVIARMAPALSDQVVVGNLPAPDASRGFLALAAADGEPVAYEDLRAEFGLPRNETGRAAVRAAILRSPSSLPGWLAGVWTNGAGRAAVAGFAGTADDLLLCRLVNEPPAASPDVALRITDIRMEEGGGDGVGGDAEVTLRASLCFNGGEKNGEVCGKVVVLKYRDLRLTPEEEGRLEKGFPLELRIVPGDARFFRLLLRD